MATPDDRHEIIVSYLVTRLQKQFPQAKITCGKKLQDIGLKPDIYVEHLDGRRWVYEAVFGNRNPEKIRQNHQRYQQAQIADTWILWDELHPRTGEKTSPNQGSISAALQPKPAYKLTKPQKALLEIQPGPIKFIYTFSVDDGMGLFPNYPESKLLNVMMMGIMIYEFDEEIVKGRYYASRDYVQISELTVDEQGKITVPAENPIFDDVYKSLGYDTAIHNPAQMMESISHLSVSSEDQKKVFLALLQQVLMSATPEEIQELQAYKQAGGSPKEDNSRPLLDIIQAFQDPQKFSLMAQEIRSAQETISQRTDIPRIILRIVQIMDPEPIISAAEIMQEQEKDQRYQAVMKSKRKT